MAAGILSLAPHLLPWQQGGVDFLLAQNDLPPEFSLCHAAQSAPNVPSNVPSVRGGANRPGTAARSQTYAQQAGRPAQAKQHEQAEYAQQVAHVSQPPQSAHAAPVSHAGQPSRAVPMAQAAPTGRPIQTAHMGQAERQAARRHAQQSEAAAPPPVTAQAVAPAPPAAPPLPPEHWPRPWRERLKATRPAPVVWTYWGLAEDLCGTPHAERRDLLKRLLVDLGHPAGTHTFWPAAMPPASAVGPVELSALEAQAQVFWSGVDMLKARAVVVMGSPAVRALELPPRLRPFQQTRHNGRLVVVLRDVDFLVEESQHYDAVREFLRQALAPFGR